MTDSQSEIALNKIGQILAEDTQYPLDNTLLYAEVDFNWVGPSIFKDLGDHLLYRSPDIGLTYPLLDLWALSDPDKRWSAIEYVIRNGRFDASFTYTEDFDPEEDRGDRRDRVVRKYFGEKPVLYPPFSDDDDDDVFEL